MALKRFCDWCGSHISGYSKWYYVRVSVNDSNFESFEDEVCASCKQGIDALKMEKAKRRGEIRG